MACSDEPLQGLEIRRMQADDVPAVAALDRAADASPWAEDIFRRELQIPIARTLVALRKDPRGPSLAGFITFWLVADEVQLHKVVVRPQERRHGIGRKLFESMIAQARACGMSRATLEVRRGNEAARRLYEAFGCRITAVRKGYYDRAGEDALLMTVELPPGPELKHERK